MTWHQQTADTFIPQRAGRTVLTTVSSTVFIDRCNSCAPLRTFLYFLKDWQPFLPVKARWLSILTTARNVWMKHSVASFRFFTFGHRFFFPLWMKDQTFNAWQPSWAHIFVLKGVGQASRQSPHTPGIMGKKGDLKGNKRNRSTMA